MFNIVTTVSIAFLFTSLFGVQWDSLDNRIAARYPEVDTISSDELYGLYQQADTELPYIIDVRKTNEFNVSHLQDAINLKTGQQIAALIVDKNADIVVYCSVGYRSAGVARELIKLGYLNVKNLRHSIFEWANKDYPLINKYGDTDKVHPFNKAWGILLNRPLHQYR